MKNPAIDVRFEVRRSHRGRGLFAREAVKRGDSILEYTGRKIPNALADTLGTRYLFALDDDWTIDGSPLSNTARWINHSCDPNCECEIEDDRIMIYAIRDIAPDEELSFDYGDEYFDEFIRPVGCLCGAASCRAPARGVRA